jgi:hypothetical protein
MAKKIPPFKRLYSNYLERENGCWEWQGQTGGTSPYGQIKVFGRFVGAHRLSYELYKGPVPENHVVCHHCDNPICINPDHLFIGTMADNMRDMISKGRRKQGKSNPRKGVKSSQAMPVMVLGKKYGSINEAEKDVGVAHGSVRYWLKTNNPKAKLITKEDFING